MNESKIVILTPEGKIEEREIEMSAANLRAILEGSIEVVPGIFSPQLSEQNILLLVNETGKIDRLASTIAVIDATYKLIDVLVGTVICVGLDHAKGDFTGLTDSQVAAIKETILPNNEHGIPYMLIASV